MFSVFAIPLLALPAILAASLPTNDSCIGTSFNSSSIIHNIFDQYGLSYDSFGATVFALLYGYPAIPFNDSSQSNHTNLLHTNLGLDNANGTQRRPNVDTIYQKATLDLSQEDLMLTIPPFQQNRFYSFDFFDVFQTNYISIGSVNKIASGNYLISPGLYTGSSGLNTTDCDSKYAGCIDFPTLNIRLLNRVELKNASDKAYVNSYYNQTKFTPVQRNDSTPLGPPLQPSDFFNLSTSPIEDVLQITAALASRNPPQDINLANSLPELLSCAGIDVPSRTYTPVPGVNLTQAYALFNATIATYKAAPGSIQNLGNGWATPNASTVGNWANETDIVARAASQTIGKLWNVAAQAIYPFPVNATFSVPEGEALLVTFVGGKPPVASDGFWSLTLYGPDGGLVANSLNRYDVSSDGKLTYPDGVRVYGETSGKGDEEVFQVLVQSADTVPPANWTANWLPCPSSGDEFSLAMRLYAEEMAALEGEYVYPVFEKAETIRGTG